MRESNPKTLRHIIHIAIEAILPCRLAIGICTHHSIRGNGSMGDVLPFSLEERVVVESNGKAIALGNGGDFYKLLLDAFSDFLARLLLQDNEVAAYFRPGVFREHARWQTDGRDKPTVLHQITAYGHILGTVQYAL